MTLTVMISGAPNAGVKVRILIFKNTNVSYTMHGVFNNLSVVFRGGLPKALMKNICTLNCSTSHRPGVCYLER